MREGLCRREKKRERDLQAGGHSCRIINDAGEASGVTPANRSLDVLSSSGTEALLPTDSQP